MSPSRLCLVEILSSETGGSFVRRGINLELNLLRFRVVLSGRVGSDALRDLPVVWRKAALRLTSLGSLAVGLFC